MVPRRLEEVVLAVPQQHYDRLIARLAMEGLFHVDEPPEGVGGAIERGYRQLQTQAGEKVSRARQFFSLAGVEPERVSGVEIEVGGWAESFARYVEEFKGVEDYYSGLAEEYSRLESRLKELLEAEARLQPVSYVGVDVASLYGSDALDFAIYYGPAREGVAERLAEIVVKAGGVVAVDEREGTLVAAVALPRGRLAGLSHRIVALGLTPYTPPEGLPGIPREALDAVREEKSRVVAEMGRVEEAARARLEDLRLFYTVMDAFSSIFKFLASTLRRGSVRIVRGFVDVRDAKRLRRIAREATDGSAIVASLGVRRGEGEVPSKVDIPSFLKPFSRVVELYGHPSPSEIVPTVFLAVTLPLTFALMFPDAGQGLLVVLFALFYMSRISRDWAYVIGVMGFASIISGILAAEAFGPLFSEIIGLSKLWYSLGLETPPYALPTYAIEHGEEELVAVLMMRAVNVSVFIGAFMLTFGTFLGVVNAIIRRDMVDLVESKLPRFIMFASVGAPFIVYMDAGKGGAVVKSAFVELGAGGLFPKLVLAGLLLGVVWMLVAGPVIAALEGHNPLSALGNSFLEAYESLIMLVGNLPSFLRIMALALAHSSLNMVLAIIAKMLMEGGLVMDVAAALIYIAGNLAIAGMEGLLAFAHSARLHYYEWFSKFYSGTGVPYTPIKLEGVRLRIAV